jgi:hypothetical protein
MYTSAKTTAMRISTFPTVAAELKSGSSDPKPSW